MIYPVPVLTLPKRPTFQSKGTKLIMSQQPDLTPQQQQLMEFLNELVTAPVTPEVLARGNQLLDDAAEECRQQQDSLRQEQGGTSDG
jgi:hypothetical protein